MAYKFQVGAATMVGALTQEGAITCDTSLTIGNAALTEAELEFLDGITAGTAAASKCMVLDSNADITGARNVTISGEIDAASGDFSGNIDVDGTANLDAVDIDGNVQCDGTITVGVNDTGYDVKFFGATAGQYMLWDESADELVLAGDSKLSFHDAAGGENIIASADGHLEVNAGTTLDMTAPTIDLNASTAVTMDTPSFIVASSSEDEPVIQLKNTSNDVGGPELRFVMDKGAAGADNDSAGKITFYADDANQDNINFGMIQVQVSDATNGSEGGKMSLQVANHDGGMGTGLLLEDGSADNEIDVELGKGSDCTITMAGTIVMPAVNSKSKIQITDNLADALSIMTAGAESYLEIVTTTNSEAMKIGHGVSGTAITIGHSTSEVTIADNLTVTGNLTVSGTTTTVDVEVVNTANGVIFEGATADGNETTLKAVDPTADRTVQIANQDGFLIPFAAVSTTAISSTPAELNLLDAITRGSIVYGNSSGASALLAKGSANTVLSSDGTDISYTTVSNAMLAGSIADSKLNTISTAGKVALSALEIDGGTDIGADLVNADLIIVDDGAGGTNRKCALSRLKTYIGNGTSAVALKDDSDTLAVGVNYFGTHGGAESVTLPASAGMTVGESVKIKAGSDCSTTNTLTISKAGSQTIDGATSVVLESPYAAIELVYVAADTWRIF